MSFDKNQFRALVADTLKAVDLYSEDAVELLMLTAAQESGLGKYIKQTKGPALGVLQAEPNTIKGYWIWLEKNRPDLKKKILDLCGPWNMDMDMRGDLVMQICLARVHYLMCPGTLPSKNDVRGMAEYYKKYYNTMLGKATVEEAMANYARYC